MKNFTTTVCCRHKHGFPPTNLNLFNYIHPFTIFQRDIQVHLAKLLYFTNLEFSWKKGKTPFSLTKNPTFWGEIDSLRWLYLDPPSTRETLGAFTSFLPASSHFNLQVLRHNGRWSASKKNRQVLLFPFANHEDPTKWRDPEKQVRSCKKKRTVWNILVSTFSYNITNYNRTHWTRICLFLLIFVGPSGRS